MTWPGPFPCHPVEAAGLVFVGVPKVATTSIKWALAAFREGGAPPSQDIDIHRWFGYTEARSLDELFEWLTTRWKRLFSFTVVRNPADRFASFYYGLPEGDRAKYANINAYLRTMTPARLESNIHTTPQTDLVGNDLSRFDFVGRMENMNEVQATLSDAASWALDRASARNQRLSSSRASRNKATALCFAAVCAGAETSLLVPGVFARFGGNTGKRGSAPFLGLF